LFSEEFIALLKNLLVLLLQPHLLEYYCLAIMGIYTVSHKHPLNLFIIID